ncbi:DUF1801 domain-containing protein [Patescibacteria group bacterium]|nr:DUF1801 domain-containing protein [Patescibacteria group bacterium]
MPTSLKSQTISAYLATVPITHRAVLKKLREQIKKLYPSATEHIGYGRPLFKLEGHPLAGFQAAKKHSSIFVWSGTALKMLGKLLDGYDTALGTIRFAPDKPLPERIVKAILAARAKEIKARWGGKGTKKS